MSYRSGGSRSRGEPGPGRAGTRRGGSGGSWDDPSWDDASNSYRQDEPRRGSSRSSQGSRRADNRDDYDNRGYGNAGSGRHGSRSRGGRDDWQLAGRSSAGGGRAGRRNVRDERRSSKPLLITLALLLMVIVAAVIGVVELPGKLAKPTVAIPDSPFATFTPGPTPTIVDHFKAYQSDRSKYAIIYPEAWNATSNERTTQGQYDYIDTFALQDAPSRLLVEQAGAFSAYTDQQIMQNEVSNATQNGVTFTKADSPAPTQKAGGATWTRLDYAVNANGNPVHMALLACHHGGRGYVIVMVSSAGEFSNDDQSVFEPMLSEFVFA